MNHSVFIAKIRSKAEGQWHLLGVFTSVDAAQEALTNPPFGDLVYDEYETGIVPVTIDLRTDIEL